MKHKCLQNPNCILYSRNLTKTEHEILCFFGNEKATKLLHVLNEAKKIWSIISKVHVYSENKYNHVASTIATSYILDNKFLSSNMEDSFPLSDITALPSTVPVTLCDVNNWKDISHITILPGWDFYDISWLLRHWEKSLGNYDFDSFFNVPSYPRDVYNNNIHPEIILFILEQYVSAFSLTKLKEQYFGLYQFFKDSLGKKLLSFFYKCTENMLSRDLIYKNLHSIYHTTSDTNPFRIYLFYLNKGLYSTSNKKYFKIQLFINQYLSYSGMFICNNYFDRRLSLLVVGIYEHCKWFQSIFDFSSLENVEDLLRVEWQHLYEMFPNDERLTWIGKHHVRQLQKKSKFWKHLYTHWEHFNRNINLWERQSQKYGDSQYGSGYPLIEFFPQSWTNQFENKKFIPVEFLKKKRKL
jgi:hypothetical protein